MLEGQPSRTAERVAAARAAHQQIDSPLVFVDPLAVRMLNADESALLRDHPERHNLSPVAKFTRAVVVVRSRIAEDEIARAAAHGVTQYVLLGAGFDTFAYRNPHEAVRVFEVDHPASQGIKRERLAAAGIDPAGRATLVPCDFAHERPLDALAARGFDIARPAVFAWLGVVMYLDPADVMRTLRDLVSLPSGTSVIFDYAMPPETLAWMPRQFYRRLLARLAAHGEPWTCFFEPGPLHADLVNLGFREVVDLGGDEINARYLANRADGLKAGSVGHILIARR
jgi:methyltransferase (TIGR00027 family)